MKILKIAIIKTAVFGLLVFTGNRLAAFPLTLTSLKGVIISTAHYGTDATTTSNVTSRVSITLNQVITVLSNNVFLDRGNIPPADMRIVLDPYTEGLYLTNNSGFSYDIAGNGFGNFRIRHVATMFNRTTGFEEDFMEIDLSFNGTQPNGQSFEMDLRGPAAFKFTVDSSGIGAISLSNKNASGYGQTNSSDSGLVIGSFKAAGSGVPEWSGPYSVYWWNNL